MKYEWRSGVRAYGGWEGFIRENPSKFGLSVFRFTTALFFVCCSLIENTSAQQLRIARIQPDALAPGMTVALEVLTMASDSGAFGNDGVSLPYGKIILERPSDSVNIIFGPVVTSWNGRMLQIPVMVPEKAGFANIRFRIKMGSSTSAPQLIRIVSPQPKISIAGSTIIGDPVNGAGTLTDGNTLVVEGIELTSPGFSTPPTTFSLVDPDSVIPGNLRYHPMTILSSGPIILTNVALSVSPDLLDGGPGGGGGGGGFVHAGGAGYTGGGSDSDGVTTTNIGSGSDAQPTSGGFSTTYVRGGLSDFTDQGGGGGTGAPFGSSGKGGSQDNPSKPGEYGGGSAGGELLSGDIPYGGGGGGFAGAGQNGGGVGSNGGKVNGGRFLAPMQGGSGGGAGNSIENKDSAAGSGGGGGGALTIIGFDTIVMSNTSIGARGSDGTSGGNVHEAGGGGGSGGGVLVTSRKKIGIENLSVDLHGGNGGHGGIPIVQTAKGGDGGVGVVRIDADMECPTCTFSGKYSSGITLYEPKDSLRVETGMVEGFGGDSLLTDSIRIYYRSLHSSWKFVDTVRFKVSGRYHWQKMIPLGYDAEMYVTAMAKVDAPQRSFANYEPDWLLSHLSSGIINVVPRPHLVFSSDTTDFGCIKIDSCTFRTVYFFNEGGKSATFDTVILNDTQFTVFSKPKLTAPYSNDSAVIKFCPKTSHDTTTLTFVSNDTLRRVTLIGCGVATDNRLDSIPLLDFGRAKKDSCLTRTVTLRSIGKDTVFFDPKIFSQSSFTIVKPKVRTAIAPDSSLIVTVQFCPKDTGAFRASFVLDDRRDLLNVIGVGTRKVFRATESLDLGRFCAGTCVDTNITITNISNDSVTITSLIGVTLLSPTPPLTFIPNSSYELRVRLCSDSGGIHNDSIRYISDADTTVTTKLHYVVTKAAIAIIGDTLIGSVCVSQCDSTSLMIYNTGTDTVTITSAKFSDTNGFIVAKSPVGDILGVGDSLRVSVLFCPKSKGERRDTLRVGIRSMGCDTSFSLMLTGVGVDGGLSFSRSEIDFGTVDTEKCTVDSLVVSNPCGEKATLDIPSLQAPFFVQSPTASQITLGRNEKVTIVYRYCPRTAGADSAIHILHDTNGNTPITLRGIGKVHPPLPTITFSVPTKKSVTEGTAFDYPLNVDDILANALIDSFFVVLRYDPVVIAPLFITGKQGQIFGNETTPGRYEISGKATTSSFTSGKIADIKMMPYLAMRDTTSVLFEFALAVPQSNITTHSGSIIVLHCGELPTNIVIVGEYEAGIPTPNPMSGNVSIPLKLGADGLLTVNITNTRGDIMLRKILPQMKKGKQTLQLDLSSLASGQYFITFDSWGWRETRSVLITK